MGAFATALLEVREHVHGVGQRHDQDDDRRERGQHAERHAEPAHRADHGEPCRQQRAGAGQHRPEVAIGERHQGQDDEQRQRQQPAHVFFDHARQRRAHRRGAGERQLQLGPGGTAQHGFGGARECALGRDPGRAGVRRERHLKHRQRPGRMHQQPGQRVAPDRGDRFCDRRGVVARALGDQQTAGAARRRGADHVAHAGQGAQFRLEPGELRQPGRREQLAPFGDHEHLGVFAREGGAVSVEVLLGRIAERMHPLDRRIDRHARRAQSRDRAEREQGQPQPCPVRQQPLEEAEPAQGRCMRRPDRKYSISRRKPNGSRACGGKPTGASALPGSGQIAV